LHVGSNQPRGQRVRKVARGSLSAEAGNDLDGEMYEDGIRRDTNHVCGD